MKPFLIACLVLRVFIVNSQETILELPELSNTNPDIDTLICDSECILEIYRDTIYIINKLGVDGYNQAVNLYEELLENCEKYTEVGAIIDAVGSEFDSLNANLHSLESKYELSLMENIRSNKQLRQQNDLISKNLDFALEDLDKARNKISQERWNSMGMKFLWGAGGVIVGTLVGGVLISISK